MKCSDFQSIAGKYGRRLREELVAAVNAHGGEYVFYDPANEECEEPNFDELPIVRASVANYDRICECAVTRVSISKRGKNQAVIYAYPQFDGYWANDEYIVDILDYQGFQDIIEAIPETKAVRDVTTPWPTELVPTPILWVDKDDIESAGYNAEGMTDERCYEIAQMVQKKLPLDDFWNTLREACDYFEVPEIDDEEAE